jgi:hypothetical protein
MRQDDNIIVYGMILVILIGVLCAVIANPIHKKNIDKSSKPKPINRTKIVSTYVSGNVESIHPWGRTEIVPVTKIELEYFEYCDEWVMSGDIIQPIGLKNYFIPVFSGKLDLDVNDLTQTWIEYEGLPTNSEKDTETYEDFRLAHIRVKKGKIIDMVYTHYRLSPNNTWSIVASWKANFNPDAPDPVPQEIVEDNIPIIVCKQCKGTGQCKTDVNKLMMDASFALFINHHLMVDKCEKCVKLANGHYQYCDIVESKHQTFLKEYGAAGPKISMAACSKCMGMGTFNSKDLSTGKWITQEEHDAKD